MKQFLTITMMVMLLALGARAVNAHQVTETSPNGNLVVRCEVRYGKVYYDVTYKGKTVITIAHRLATIEAADQILVIDNGQVAERGRHEELVRLGGKYAEFVKIRQMAENWQITTLAQ